MEELHTSIIVGIVTSLIIAVIIIPLQFIFRKSIIPWYQKQIYKDVPINGEWESIYENSGNKVEEAITVSQIAHRVEGSITCLAGPDKGSVYSFVGEFKNLILTASYTAITNGTFDRGTFTMMLKENGAKLVGSHCFYSNNDHEVKSSNYTWKRK